MKHQRLRVAAVALICALLCAAVSRAHLSDPIDAQVSGDAGQPLFLPFVAGTPSPAGVYDCDEYEFGLIWTSELVTLHPDGSSTYSYAPPYTQVVTGTWVYTATSQEIGFTNFRWITATVTLPNRLSARRYLPQVGFEIAMNCLKRVAALANHDRRLAGALAVPDPIACSRRDPADNVNMSNRVFF